MMNTNHINDRTDKKKRKEFLKHEICINFRLQSERFVRQNEKLLITSFPRIITFITKTILFSHFYWSPPDDNIDTQKKKNRWRSYGIISFFPFWNAHATKQIMCLCVCVWESLCKRRESDKDNDTHKFHCQFHFSGGGDDGIYSDIYILFKQKAHQSIHESCPLKHTERLD